MKTKKYKTDTCFQYIIYHLVISSLIEQHFRKESKEIFNTQNNNHALKMMALIKIIEIAKEFDGFFHENEGLFDNI